MGWLVESVVRCVEDREEEEGRTQVQVHHQPGLGKEGSKVQRWRVDDLNARDENPKTFKTSVCCCALGRSRRLYLVPLSRMDGCM